MNIITKSVGMMVAAGLFAFNSGAGEIHATPGADSGNAALAAGQETAAPPVKKLKPQTTCPVMGGEIDRELYVDHKGKRIYVCCPGCLGKLKKNPEKYIKKLERMGQAAEDVPEKETGEEPSADSSKTKHGE